MLVVPNLCLVVVYFVYGFVHSGCLEFPLLVFVLCGLFANCCLWTGILVLLSLRFVNCYELAVLSGVHCFLLACLCLFTQIFPSLGGCAVAFV